jgi:BirA family biotin operon repressor/biotin-[acetyl-CoA-carboxylase] ligase
MRILPDLEAAPALVLARGGELGRPMHLLAETTSTNDEAKRGAKQGAPHGATWVTETQFAGRGRHGRAWFGAPGESLLFSVLLRLACPPSRLPPLALVAGLAVRDAVARAAPAARVLLKWPNDVIVREAGGPLRKLAGVLVETTMTGHVVEAVVVGVGINVHTRVFPDDIASRATSVGVLAGAPVDRAAILADVLEGLDREVRVVAARGLGLLRARLEAADGLRGERVKRDQGEGVAQGIDGEGRLVVRGDDGEIMRWGAGEVELL